MYIDNIASNGVTLNSAGKSFQIEVYEKHIKKLQEENKKLKSRIDKAIEYIENEDEKLRLKLYYGKWAHNKLDEYDADYLCEEIIKNRDYLLEMLKGEKL